MKEIDEKQMESGAHLYDVHFRSPSLPSLRVRHGENVPHDSSRLIHIFISPDIVFRKIVSEEAVDFEIDDPAFANFRIMS